jgi:hypothetical protein
MTHSRLRPAIGLLLTGSLLMPASIAVMALYSTPASAQIVVGPVGPPPPPRVEVLPPPRRGFVWDPGHWRWVGNRYAWIGGHWRPMRGGRWAPGHWVQRGPNWMWAEGRWVR